MRARTMADSDVCPAKNVDEGNQVCKRPGAGANNPASAHPCFWNILNPRRFFLSLSLSLSTHPLRFGTSHSTFSRGSSRSPLLDLVTTFARTFDTLNETCPLSLDRFLDRWISGARKSSTDCFFLFERFSEQASLSMVP